MLAVKAAKAKQIDLLVAFLGDVPLRDDREGLSVPLFSLSKGRRTAPIIWQSSDGARYVRVTANATHGMATIWDSDVLIWAVSQVNAAVEAGKPVLRTLKSQPHELLRAIGRGVGGKDYAALEEALNRLAGTLVETNIRAAGKTRKSAFHLLEDWSHITGDATGRSEGMTLTLPHWLYDGVVKHRDVLAVSPEYFQLSSGIARFLYRIARRHGGKQVTGFRFSMKALHARSGSVQPMKDFARAVRKVVEAQGVPEYRLDLIEGQHGDEFVSMIRDVAKVGLPQRRGLAKVGLPPTTKPVDSDGGSPAYPHGGSPARTRGITRRNAIQLIDIK
jgi:plasmid replication initiation protein